MPVAISSTLLPESKSCGAMLRGAFDQFSRHVGNVDLLQGETAEERAALLDGVLECLDAAEDELSTIQQEKLLRSAQFGKCFLDGMDPVPEAAEAADATAEPAVPTASAASAASAASGTSGLIRSLIGAAPLGSRPEDSCCSSELVLGEVSRKEGAASCVKPSQPIGTAGILLTAGSASAGA